MIPMHKPIPTVHKGDRTDLHLDPEFRDYYRINSDGTHTSRVPGPNDFLAWSNEIRAVMGQVATFITFEDDDGNVWGWSYEWKIWVLDRRIMKQVIDAIPLAPGGHPGDKLWDSIILGLTVNAIPVYCVQDLVEATWGDG